MKPKQYFDRLGDDVQAAWARTGLDERALPEIAAEALRARPPAEHLAFDDVLAWALECPPAHLTPQRDLGYWAPLLTVYAGHRFYIAFHLWLDATPRLHSHAFTGAFQVVFGSTLQARYRFEPSRVISQRLRTGALELRGCEVVEPGTTVPLWPGAESIHGLFHLVRPTCTLVIRTEKDPQLGPECNYFPPTLGADLPGDAAHLDGVVVRRMQTVEFLIRHDPSAVERLPRIMQGWDTGTIVAVVRHLAFLADAPGDGTDLLVHLLEPVADRDVVLAQSVFDALVEDRRRREVRALRSHVDGADDLLTLGLLLHAPDRATACSLLAAHDVEPAIRVERLLDRLAAAPGASGLDVSPAEHEALARWVEQEPSVASPVDERLARIRTHPVFVPLFR